ncbi:hypothetical protein AArc1_3150 [Natrarchaeobaculum sulfurireducens]|uniref:Uncharacterized protein n=1 Tax=Natrarchaeobaculum sulfurireducens TaxID=2044521 RepID=A0A346PIW1_9EURY|nr:hypothetical protein AArc1_3150 [Natrarchaeobaculum sulfurireducens]
MSHCRKTDAVESHREERNRPPTFFCPSLERRTESEWDDSSGGPSEPVCTGTPITVVVGN